MFVDFVLNGQGQGPVGEQLASCRFDTGLLRPFIDYDGQRYVTVNTGRREFDPEKQRFNPVFEDHLVANLMNRGISSPVFNAMSLRKDEWIQLDTQVLAAARLRLRAWADLASRSSFGGFNAMSKMVLEHETMSDVGSAVVDMDGIGAEPTNDSPQYQLEGLPLPITHAGFHFSERRLAVSRNSGAPLDITMAEMAGRRVAETIEKTLLGVETGITYGKATEYSRNPTVYGYTNFPSRIIKSDLTAPTGSNGTTILSEFLEMRQLLYDAKFFGPFVVYVSPAWDRYLDNLFSTTEPSAGTLRSRLLQIEGISSISTVDYLGSGFTVLMIQMTSDVARAINGMGITTIQWESKGGLQLNFKVMAIMVPQLRADFNGNCGILHGSAS